MNEHKMFTRIKTGDELLKRAIETDETINIDMIWDVIDWYKQGIVLTREKEVSSCKIGKYSLGYKIYD